MLYFNKRSAKDIRKACLSQQDRRIILQDLNKSATITEMKQRSKGRIEKKIDSKNNTHWLSCKEKDQKSSTTLKNSKEVTQKTKANDNFKQKTRFTEISRII